MRTQFAPIETMLSAIAPHDRLSSPTATKLSICAPYQLTHLKRTGKYVVADRISVP
jgi:hypothetical protein